jgi:hypothetical protein
MVESNRKTFQTTVYKMAASEAARPFSGSVTLGPVDGAPTLDERPDNLRLSISAAYSFFAAFSSTFISALRA